MPKTITIGAPKHVKESIEKAQVGEHRLQEAQEIIKDLFDRIEECSHCKGTGFEYEGGSDACSICGGQGKVLDATPLISEITDLLRPERG